MSNGPQILFNGLLGQVSSSFSSTKSLDFDGVDDYVSISNSSTLDITGNGSISFWINAATLASYTGIVSKVENTASVVSNAQYHIGMLSNGVRCVITGTDLKIGSEDVGTVPTITTGVWEHYVLTWDGSNLSLYKNGVFAASKTQVSNPSTNTEPVLIGYRNGYDYFDGKIDEVSIFNTVLSAGDVTAMYNSGQPTDLTSLSPVAWYRMGENSTFKSPQILMPENTNKDKASNYSFAFDGVDDYVDCGNVWNLSTYTWSPFTLSFWYKGINPIVGAVHTKSLFQFMATGSQHIGIYDGYLGAANVRLYLLFGTTNNYWTVGSNGTVDLFDNEWHNVVIVFPPGSNDGVDDASSTLYIDGTLITKDSSATGTPPIAAFSWQMFNIMEGAWNPLQGNLDEVALWKTDQTANIATIYNSGTPADLTSLSPVSWWRMGEEAIFNSTNWLLPNKAQDVYSRYSMAFDGVDDYVDCGNDSSLHNSNFTISLWVYQPSISGNDEIISNGLGAFGAKDHGFNINRYYGNYRFYMGDGTTSYSSSWAGAVVDTWQHLVMSYDGTDMKAYLNGVLKDTVAVPSISYSASAQNLFRIGKSANSGLEFTGNIDEVSLFSSAKAIGDLWDGSGKPTDLTGQSGLVSWWRMGEDATFSTNWTIPDKIGSNTGTSANMTNDDLSGNAPAVTGNGTSANMTIEDRVGDASNSSNNSLSYNMDAADIVEDTP